MFHVIHTNMADKTFHASVNITLTEGNWLLYRETLTDELTLVGTLKGANKDKYDIQNMIEHTGSVYTSTLHVISITFYDSSSLLSY